MESDKKFISRQSLGFSLLLGARAMYIILFCALNFFIRLIIRLLGAFRLSVLYGNLFKNKFVRLFIYILLKFIRLLINVVRDLFSNRLSTVFFR